MDDGSSRGKDLPAMVLQLRGQGKWSATQGGMGWLVLSMAVPKITG